MLVSLQQALRILVAVQIDQASQKQVPHALVVDRVQPQHLRKMLDRLGPLTRFPETLGQPQPGPHVGPRPLVKPEMTGRGLEALRADRPLARGHAFLQELAGLVARPGLVGQNHVGVGAIGRYAQGLPRQFRLLLRPRILPGQVGNLLGDRQGTARFSATGSQLSQKSFHGSRSQGRKPRRLGWPPRLGVAGLIRLLLFLGHGFPYLPGPEPARNCNLCRNAGKYGRRPGTWEWKNLRPRRGPSH